MINDNDLVVVFKCRCCPGVIKCHCTSCALLYWKVDPIRHPPGADMWTYLSTDVSHHRHLLLLMNTTFQEPCHLVTSEYLVLCRVSDKIYHVCNNVNDLHVSGMRLIAIKIFQALISSALLFRGQLNTWISSEDFQELELH